jgi:hypothetical protein
LNQLTATTTSNNIVSILSNCTGSMTNINTLDFGGTLNITSGSNVTLNQNIQSAVNFKCLQQTSVQNQLVQNMSSTILQAIQNNVSSDVLTQLNAQAQSASSAAFATLSGSKSGSEINTSSNTAVLTQNNKTLQNVITMAVTNNFTQNTINACVSSMLNQQIASFQGGANVTGGSTLTLNQSVATSQVANCIQNSTFSSGITNALVQFYQMNVKDDTTTQATTEQTGTAESEAKSTGFFADIGAMFNGIFSGIGSALSSVLGIGTLSTTVVSGSSSCCSLICCIIFIIILYFIFRNPDQTKDMINNGQDFKNLISSGKNLIKK